MPKVSIIMPVYNGAKYIGEAIESVLEQIFLDWELLIVDDGSTDETMNIIDRYREPRIRVFQQGHQGEGAARNMALWGARGQYVAFLDSDDWLLPCALQLHVEFLDNNPDFNVVYSDGFGCDKDGNPLGRFSKNRLSHQVGDVLETMIIHSLYGGSCGVSFRRHVVTAHGFQFDETLTLATDWDFFIKLAEVARFGYIDMPTYKYRLHSSSISAVLSHRRREFHAKIQCKVLRQPYFSCLSLKTKRIFFYQLQIEYLRDKPQEQQVIFESSQFLSLPAPTRAEFFRLVGGEYLLDKAHTEFALFCLKQAVELQPKGLKQQVLWRLARVNTWTARLFLKVWRDMLGNVWVG